MRSLLVKTTAAAATVVALTVLAFGIVSQTSWPLLTVRAATAFAIVSAAGWATGWILMRTALRRWYEAWRSARAETRPRGHR